MRGRGHLPKRIRLNQRQHPRSHHLTLFPSIFISSLTIQFLKHAIYTRARPSVTPTDLHSIVIVTMHRHSTLQPINPPHGPIWHQVVFTASTSDISLLRFSCPDQLAEQTFLRTGTNMGDSLSFSVCVASSNILMVHRTFCRRWVGPR